LRHWAEEERANTKKVNETNDFDGLGFYKTIAMRQVFFEQVPMRDAIPLALPN